MVTKMNFQKKGDTSMRLQAITTADENVSIRSEEDGFYSSCGQAFIRINNK
ncbi:hypothetical protein [Methanolobus sp.]|jgi:hypothetical protein|uniref:hypothetical protein n=1 Tax=Methanolobus sp. TaxID=1874737 RepID=UPI0025FB5AC8|nr:hypothetical protein [Methanolobus sp.]